MTAFIIFFVLATFFITAILFSGTFFGPPAFKQSLVPPFISVFLCVSMAIFLGAQGAILEFPFMHMLLAGMIANAYIFMNALKIFPWSYTETDYDVASDETLDVHFHEASQETQEEPRQTSTSATHEPATVLTVAGIPVGETPVGGAYTKRKPVIAPELLTVQPTDVALNKNGLSHEDAQEITHKNLPVTELVTTE